MNMDDDIAATIEDVGRPLKYRKVRTGPYNPETSTSPIESKEYDGSGFLLDYKDRDRDGTLIKAGDRKAVFEAAKDFPAPEQNDILIAKGKEYNIENVRTVEESGAAVIYSCQVRG